MFILHIALQGCVRPNNVPYGLTPDTGGHIKYLLELCAAADGHDCIERQQIVVRRFYDDHLGGIYDEPFATISQKTELIRINGAHRRYLSKEEMHQDLPMLADSLARHISALPRRPDMIHAHYVDAGVLATQMKRRFAIPFVFTAHSLGRVKALVDSAVDPTVIERRIAAEETVIAAADMIVASSIDEAEFQYGLYDTNAAHKTVVNRPGCDLARFGKCEHGAVTRELSRWLNEPDKPPILALARPVSKKNLAGIVRAYGRSHELQAYANLVIYAGTRETIADKDAESRHVLRELLELVDRYDLWGKVALPKTHVPDDVPKIFSFAADRQGLFANVALNEPFGLTFLEAAAAGLPVVATNSGGANDILARCQNGLLVDPHDEGAIASAMLQLLQDHVRWRRARANGLANCGQYSWERHVHEYASTLKRLTARAPVRHADKPRRLQVHFVDNMLFAEREGVPVTPRGTDALAYVYGGNLHSVLQAEADFGLPQARAYITAAGTEIYLRRTPHDPLLTLDERWNTVAKAGWQRDEIARALATLPFLKQQGAREQRPLKLSYVLKDRRKLGAMKACLAREGLCATINLHSGGYVDVVPISVTVENAIAHAAAHLGVAPSKVSVAAKPSDDLQRGGDNPTDPTGFLLPGALSPPGLSRTAAMPPAEQSVPGRSKSN